MIDGLFWEDEGVTKRSRGGLIPPIPDTGWQRPSYFPDLSSAKVIAIDCETYDPDLKKYGPGWARGVGHIVGVSVAVEGGSWYFPMRHETETAWNMDPATVLKWLSVELSRPHQMKVGANLTYDVGWLRQEGVQVKGFLFEVQFAEALIDDKARVSLDTIAEKYLGVKKETNLLYEFIRQWFPQCPESSLRKHIHLCPPRLVGRYAEVDAELPLRLWPILWQRLHLLDVVNVFEMECKLIYMMIAMRFRGVRVDLDKAEQAQVQLTQKALQLHDEIKARYGKRIKVNSTNDIARLFEDQGLKHRGKFDKEFLEGIDHPLSELILQIRKVEKLSSTFIGSYILGSNVKGRVHGQFHLMKGDDNGAIGGRMSSSTPNLQNLSSRDKIYAPIVRGCFVPDFGAVGWRKYDYSSIEYRGLASDAVGAGADELRANFAADPFLDYHEIVRQLIYKVTGILLDRSPTKTINFGLCIAAGQEVLTDKGLVPIEKVTTSHRVWDGVEWVSHDGLLDQGVREVITYDGLTATPDHEVFTNDGRKISIGRAASASDRPGIARTGNGEHTIRYTGTCTWVDSRPSRKKVGQGVSVRLQLLQRASCGMGAKHKVRRNKKLSMPTQVQGQKSKDNRRQIRRDCAAMQARHLLREKLRGQGNKKRIRVAGTVYQMGSGKLASRRLQGTRLGSNRQQRELQTRQLAASDSIRKSNEPKKYAQVYDLLNAGPRRRFTVADCLVSNCYGMGMAKLARALKLSMKETKEMFDAYHTGVPFVKSTFDHYAKLAENDGVVRTVLGRRALFEEWGPLKNDQSAQGLPYEQAVLRYGAVKRVYTHKALNRRLQGSAADLMKMACLKCWESGVYDYTGLPHLIVHDEKDFSDPGGQDEAFRYMREVMETAVPFNVPVIADGEFGPSWGAVGAKCAAVGGYDIGR